MLTDVRPFRPSISLNTLSLAVTGVAQTITVFANTVGVVSASMRIVNLGTDTIFIKLITSKNGTAAATTTNPAFPVLPNTVETFSVPESFIGISVIGVTGSGSTVYVTVGESA